MTAAIVTEAHKKQYEDQGYFILERAMSEEHLAMLRQECQWFIDRKDADLAAKGVDVEGITHKGKRYFISNQYHQSAHMHEFIFSPLMAAITQAVLGPDVYLFNEQWVVKGADVGMKFAWHQDSGYVGYPHAPYLTCWCPLDDVDENNGMVYILPHDRAGTRDHIFNHQVEAGTNDKVGYTGNDPGVPIVCPAGSIVCFSSYTFHRSGANHTHRMRRVYLPQYSHAPIHRPNGDLHALAVPFVKDGRVVYEHAVARSVEG